MKWSTYNQSLVRRGQILIGFDVIDNWDTELKEMNKDKVGEPFQYPNTFFSFYWDMPKHIFIYHLDKLRGLHKRGHAKGKVPSIPDYTTINRRINRLDIKIKDDFSNKEPKNNYITITIDSTGIKVTNTEVSGLETNGILRRKAI